MDAHNQNTQQQENGTTADCWGNSYSLEQWNNGRIEMRQNQANLCDLNDAIQSVDLIAWRRLAVSSWNMVIYILTESDYIVIDE